MKNILLVLLFLTNFLGAAFILFNLSVLSNDYVNLPLIGSIFLISGTYSYVMYSTHKMGRDRYVNRGLIVVTISCLASFITQKVQIMYITFAIIIPFLNFLFVINSFRTLQRHSLESS
jgi:hypothetical protein